MRFALWVVALFLFLIVSTHPQAQVAIIQQVYLPTTEIFSNPERGFYYQDAPMWLGLERVPQDLLVLRQLRADGISLVRYYFLIDEFRTRPIDDETLAYIQSQFDAVRSAGLKIIPRFAYNFPEGGDYPFQEPDASLGQVLAHLEQLTPILRQNADIIAFMEIGFVGAWGEWHSSTNGLVDEETGLTDASRAIIDALLMILPKDRMIAMRYLPYKRDLYGEAPLTSQQAFTGIPQARMGHHNDCFLASPTDWGTYSHDETYRATEKAYLHADNRYLPQGGETCNVADDAQPYIQCDNALQELAYLRFSTLNIDYHPDVLALWREQGCYDEIAQRLGYRLQLVGATMPQQARITETLYITLALQNVGFASPYNPRGFEIVLRADDGSLYHFPFEQTHDPRRWLPDLGIMSLDLMIDLPAEMPIGTYEVLVNLPDPAPTLYGIPEYSIRLANTDVWEHQTGFNRLGVTIEVTSE